MLATLESFFHRLRRRFSRSEWAIRRFRFPVSNDTDEEPGLLLVQIDGLSRRQMEAAVAAGRMPFLARLIKRSGYELHTFYPGAPSTTPAVQAELYYGVRAGVPAFSFLDRERGEMGSMFNSDWAQRFEKEFSASAEGLLKGGSSWSNIYTGGAAAEESHFCVATLGLATLWRTGKIGSSLLFLILEIPAVLRISFLMALEFLLGLGDALAGIVRGRHAFLELGMLLSRMGVGIGLREVVTVGAKVDLARGQPIVHVNFLGYDELSHRRGPDSAFAHWSLRGIDSAIRNLTLEAHRSRRRDYQVWIFSDHGQERTRSLNTIVPGGLEAVVSEALEGVKKHRPDKPRPSPGWPLTRRKEDVPATVFSGEKPFAIAAMGPVGHLYFAQPPDDDAKTALALRLIKKVPGVLRVTQKGTVVWHHPEGESLLPENLPPPLTNHPPALRRELITDLIGFAKTKNAGDLIILGWGHPGDPWTFASERGSHAGPGLDETQGFLLVPPATQLPEGAKDFVRPAGLRAAALALLGREPLGEKPIKLPTPPEGLTVLSYNVHSCIGMDGRVSPRRIARAIAQQGADLVALQELDHGRPRSRAEDQAGAIAAQLGYHLAFCPAVIHGEEQYGHALLSRWPLEVVKTGSLPSLPGGFWPEPRAALWVRVHLHDFVLNVLSTHLGLTAAERLKQMSAILGDEWLGPVLDKEPVILCGDFNLTPGSPAHRLAATRLKDVAHEIKRGVKTFSSIRLVAQLDHIFVSPHFVPESVFAAQNDLTRVASDHLPLIARLRLAGGIRSLPGT